MPGVKITQNLFKNLDYDINMTSTTTNVIDATAGQQVTSPTILLVLSDSDLNASSYHLSESVKKPNANNAIVTVLVQESVITSFVAKVQEKMEAYTPSTSLTESYRPIKEKLRQVNARTVRPCNTDDETNFAGPTIVYDFTHEQLGLNYRGSIVTLHAFRTTKEAITLCTKQGIDFVNISIWSENHARAYEIVAALHSQNYFINCYDVSLECLRSSIDSKKSEVVMEQGYHYETFVGSDGNQRNVVFPFGTVFAN